jgi:hypothetical protein
MMLITPKIRYSCAGVQYLPKSKFPIIYYNYTKKYFNA